METVWGHRHIYTKVNNSTNISPNILRHMSGAQRDNIANRRETHHHTISPMEVLRPGLFELVPSLPPRDSPVKAPRFRIAKVPAQKLKTGPTTLSHRPRDREVSELMPREAVPAPHRPFHPRRNGQRNVNLPRNMVVVIVPTVSEENHVTTTILSRELVLHQSSAAAMETMLHRKVLCE
jgi:hypothetical protein